MKKLFAVVTALTLTMMFSVQTFAHSYLSGSNPSDGEVKTEPVQAITLNFDEKIMEGSFIDLTTTNGEAIEVTNIEIGNGYLTGTLAEPLANNDYTVNWSIISADGHPLEGSFSFTVKVPVIEPTGEEADKEQSNEQSSSTEADDVANQPVDKNTSEEQSNSFIFGVLAFAALILVVGLIFVLKRKK